MSRQFFSMMLQHVPADVESIVLVTHLVPDADEFVLALNDKVPVSAVIPKPSSLNRSVLSKIQRDVPVLNYSRRTIASQPAAFLSDLKKRVCDKRFAIIDTGGYFSHVLDDMAKPNEFNLAGIVEDTENGHKKYESFLASNDERRELPFPILSVARSKLKEPEDFLVGQAVVFSADALLRECGILLTGKQAAVLGYGKIGSSIAANLRAKGVRVDVHDSNPVRQALACAHGYSLRSRAAVLSQADVIFGATGNKSVRAADIDAMKEGAFIFTATSGDDEIDGYDDILAHRKPSPLHPRVCALASRKGATYLCNDGNAINFMHGGVLGPFIKLVQAELIFALSQLDTAHRGRIRHLSDESKRFIADLWLSHFHPPRLNDQ